MLSRPTTLKPQSTTQPQVAKKCAKTVNSFQGVIKFFGELYDVPELRKNLE
ncbi:Uncharacterized protein APZ42_003896 [Daphnia magna]|uniref:Uncharacterized protein n=1 Tax=Daphnia magna TaxID=35525 RepID=A0A162CW53_9CRUS|nr:Uncharacterized protein APZ42_003896 [Daphnia magna]